MAPAAGKGGKKWVSKEEVAKQEQKEKEKQEKQKDKKEKSKSWESASPDEWVPKGAKGWGKGSGKKGSNRQRWVPETHAWEAEMPTWPKKKLDWDVCWDFSKYGTKKSSYKSTKGGNWQSYSDQSWSMGAFGQMQNYAMGTNPFSGINAQMAMGMGVYGLPPFLEAKHREWQGQKQAVTDISTAKPPPPPPSPPPPPPEGKVFEGSLKTLSRRNGYGFISCNEAYQFYGRDTYLPKELVPEDAKPLDRISFTMSLSKKGHPQAETAEIVKI